MIYTGLSRTGEIESVKAHGGGDIAEVYGGLNETDPIFYKSRTITGVPPLSFKALGKPLSDYLISGNTVQNGTPTPEAPVDVQGCGVRTMQLFEDKIVTCSIDANGRLITNSDFDMYIAKVEQGVTYIASSSITGGFFTTKPEIGSVSYNGQRMAYAPRTFTAPITGYVTFRVNAGSDEPMLNAGSTALPYEPYGYKLPLNVNGTEYPIYLGEAQTTRRIKRLAMTGEENNWGEYTRSDSTTVPYLPLSDFKGASATNIKADIKCTHYDTKTQANIQNTTNKTGIAGRTSIGIIIADESISTLADFKSYLAAQYAAGTPVTVWYVLTEPETGIVNEPLHKIGDYADTITMAQAGVAIPTFGGDNIISFGTTVKPSVSITGNIKEVLV